MKAKLDFINYKFSALLDLLKKNSISYGSLGHSLLNEHKEIISSFLFRFFAGLILAVTEVLNISNFMLQSKIATKSSWCDGKYLCCEKNVSSIPQAGRLPYHWMEQVLQ